MVKDASSRNPGGAGERRRFGRFATRLPMATQRDDLARRSSTPEEARCRLRLEDFSLGGLRADSAVPLKLNERLTLRLPPTGTRPALQLTGRVVHCRRRDQRYQVGIEFCQTREGTAASPFCYLPRLFSVAAEFAADIEAEPAESVNSA